MVAHVADPDGSREHLQQRPVVLAEVDRERATGAPEGERALSGDEPVKVGAKRVDTLWSLDPVAGSWNAKASDPVELATMALGQHCPIRGTLQFTSTASFQISNSRRLRPRSGNRVSKSMRPQQPAWVSTRHSIWGFEVA